MSTVPNSIVDSNSYRSTSLPDELSPAAYAQFVAECNAWHDEKAAQEAENESDYFESLARLQRQNDELAELTARANAERDAFHADFMAHCKAVQADCARLSQAI